MLNRAGDEHPQVSAPDSAASHKVHLYRIELSHLGRLPGHFVYAAEYLLGQENAASERRIKLVNSVQFPSLLHVLTMTYRKRPWSGCQHNLCASITVSKFVPKGEAFETSVPTPT